MPAVAAIDIGSNAMRLLIGQVNDRGNLICVENYREAVRLGRDVFSSSRIEEKTMNMAVKALARFRQIMDQHGVTRYRAVATSAMREATNALSLVARISSECRIDLEVIGAEEEARLVFAAASQKVGFARGHSILIDIGGGSVEVSLISESQIVRSESYQLGTVRLLQLFEEKKHDNRLFARMIGKYVRAIRRELRRELGDIKISRCVVTGGNVETLGELRVSRLRGPRNDRLKAKELGKLIQIISSLDVSERITKLKLRPDRADVILPATFVLQEILREVKLGEIRIPHVGLKDGLLVDLLGAVPEKKASDHRRELRAYARGLGRKYRFDRIHADTVASLATNIFDQTRDIHKLDDQFRLLLELAAILHDIGHFVSVNGHHKHSWYLINSSPFVGLSSREKGIVAAIARYHRKAPPSIDHIEFSSLGAQDRRVVLQLAAILRVADAIDSEHTGEPPEVSFKLKNDVFMLSLGRNGDSQLERWSVMKKGRLFEEVFGRKLEVH